MRAHFGPSFSVGEHPSRMKAAAASGNVLLRGIELAYTWYYIWMGQGQPLLALLEAADQSDPKLWLGIWDHHSTCPGLHWVPDLASPAPTLLPSRVKLSMLGTIQSTHLEQNQLGSEPQAIFSSTLGTKPTTNGVVSSTEHRRNPSSHVALAPALPSLLPTSVTAASIPWEETWLTFSTKSHWIHTQTRHPSRPGWVTALPNFREIEKLMENEKTKEFVSNARTRGKPLHTSRGDISVSHQELCLNWQVRGLSTLSKNPVNKWN